MSMVKSVLTICHGCGKLVHRCSGICQLCGSALVHGLVADVVAPVPKYQIVYNLRLQYAPKESKVAA